MSPSTTVVTMSFLHFFLIELLYVGIVRLSHLRGWLLRLCWLVRWLLIKCGSVKVYYTIFMSSACNMVKCRFKSLEGLLRDNRRLKQRYESSIKQKLEVLNYILY